MMVVLKSNGKVGISVNYIKLNENVCCELHSLSTAEKTLSKLSRAKIFSKLDANSSFWKISLEESKHLMTCITLAGRFCFNRFIVWDLFGTQTFSKSDVKHPRKLSWCHV